MVLFFLFCCWLYWKGPLAGHLFMAGGRLSGALPDSVMLSFATRVTYDNDIHQKKKKREQFLIFIYQFQELIRFLKIEVVTLKG